MNYFQQVASVRNENLNILKKGLGTVSLAFNRLEDFGQHFLHDSSAKSSYFLWAKAENKAKDSLARFLNPDFSWNILF